MAYLTGLCLLFFLLCGAGVPSWAKAHLSEPQLRKLGISLQLARLGAFSTSGELFVVIQPHPQLQEKAKGFGWELVLFRLGTGAVIQGVSKLPLPVGRLDQLVVSDDGRLVLIVGERGTKLLGVDVAKASVSVLFQHQQGVPGIRLDPLIWSSDGRFYGVGYFYDETQTDQGTHLVEITPLKRGREIFASILTMQQVENTVGGVVRGENYTDFPRLYFVVDDAKSLKLMLYEHGVTRQVDEGMVFGVLAVGRHRVLYPVRRPNGLRELVLRDVKTGTAWHVGEPNLPLTYPYLSSDGKVVVSAILHYAERRMTYFYGEEKKGYRLSPIPSLENVSIGTFRLSPDGRRFAYLGETGLLFDQIPAK